MGKMGNCDEKSWEVWYAVKSSIGYLLICMGERRLFVMFGCWIICCYPSIWRDGNGADN